jgi:hypothetical protein
MVSGMIADMLIWLAYDEWVNSVDKAKGAAFLA